MAVPSAAPSRSSRVELGSSLWRLGCIVVAASSFVLGVLIPYLADDDVPPVDSAYDALLWPGLASTFFLPLVACGVAAFSGAKLPRSDGAARAANLAAVALSVAGVLVYCSPWGVDATRWLLD